MVCTVLGVRVSKWKWLEPLEKGRWANKRVRTEEELDVESEGSGTGGWKGSRCLQEISSTLLGLKERMEDQNELWREQNSYLHRIARCLENGLGPEEIEVLVEDSTIRE